MLHFTSQCSPLCRGRCKTASSRAGGAGSFPVLVSPLYSLVSPDMAVTVVRGEYGAWTLIRQQQQQKGGEASPARWSSEAV
ncbi:hypothetical protein XELAEV_18025277mg [Xenopus laevis]|uniref:Uncharacterized protein n=1 Tax=Xenopus laevis TaxID=8355 RepID=A0A974HM63_XENLA|nr:hypothetical protein XELAEV_18025277mg [Xenopus laevis]